MNKTIYLIYQAFLKIKYQKKRYGLYIFSFYIGLLLPAFCIANIRSVDQVIRYTTFDGMEESVEIDWFSEEFDIIEWDGEREYSISAFFEEDFSEWGHQYISIAGINEIDFYPKPEMIGRYFSRDEFREGKEVCLLNQRYADQFRYQIGDLISIRGEDCEIIGFIKDEKSAGIFLPYQTMGRIYQCEENIQFTGIFLAKDELEKEKIVKEITEQITRRGENAEVLEVIDGQELYKNAMQTKVQWRVVRGAFAVVAILFFLLNEIIVLIGKVEKERQIIGVNMAMGASAKEVKLCLFFETLIITAIAAGLVLVTLLPLARMVSLESAVVLDGVVIMVFLGVAFTMCEILTWGAMRKIKTKQISAMMKTREL